MSQVNRRGLNANTVPQRLKQNTATSGKNLVLVVRVTAAFAHQPYLNTEVTTCRNTVTMHSVTIKNALLPTTPPPDEAWMRVA